MPTSMTGVVKSMARNGKAFCLEEDPTTWFSVYDQKQLDSVNRGATVEFTFTSKNVGGRVYNNIQKNVKVINPGMGGDAPDASGAVAAQEARPQTVTFGNISLSRDRCIARQNAVNVMSTVLAQQFSVDPTTLDRDTVENFAMRVIQGAMIIEEYTTGDLDIKDAQKAMQRKREAEKSLVEATPSEVLSEFDDYEE